MYMFSLIEFATFYRYGPYANLDPVPRNYQRIILCLLDKEYSMDYFQPCKVEPLPFQVKLIHKFDVPGILQLLQSK